MEVSKLSFSAETRAALIARPLTKTDKAKLRRNRVKEYIRSQPAGTLLTNVDLAMAAGYRPDQRHGYMFIKRMVDKREITRDASHIFGKASWSVYGDATVTKPADPKPVELVDPKLAGLTPPPIASPAEVVEPKFDMHLTDMKQLEQVSVGWIIQKAKDFTWQYNTDSLREFVNHLSLIDK